MIVDGKNKAHRAAEAQRRYCSERGYPEFAPKNGVCFRCGANIYAPCGASHGYDAEYAASCLVTCCPHCHATFTD